MTYLVTIVLVLDLLIMSGTHATNTMRFIMYNLKLYDMFNEMGQTIIYFCFISVLNLILIEALSLGDISI